MADFQKITVIGAGAWGTALAMAAQRAGRDVLIQAYEPEVADSINKNHVNATYLPGYPLDPSIRATPDLHEAIARADAVLMVAPAQHVRGVCQLLKDDWPAHLPMVICAKGIEIKTEKLLSEVVAEVLPQVPLAVLSGPSFAAEVARENPTAVTLAAETQELAIDLTGALASPLFRIYRSTDVVGAQIGGAVKNVLAIACGIAQGKEMGDNARAFLITRGLAEITRLGLAKGAQMETLMGLSGIGDLTLTCSAMQSRNFSLGFALGKGNSLEEILGGRNAVTEGVHTAASVKELATSLGVDLPICTAVSKILNDGADIEKTIAGLLDRPPRDETG